MYKKLSLSRTQVYKVKYDDRENDELSTMLEPDVDLTDPFERCRQNYFNHYTDYLKQNIVFKIGSSNKNTISSLKASRTLFRPYQFKPLLKFLNSDDRRLLIADEVGLGKTIEAGHIMLELKARNEFHNALVVCPMSLRSKWVIELSDKFGLDFSLINKKEDLIRELQFHNGHVRAVVNYDKIREDSDILKYIAEKKINFSIVVCDESHRLRNNNTLIYHGATELLKAADSVVFMSATPIMLNEENLYNQLHLLDSGIYDNYEVFRNNLQLNRPFVKALSELNAGVNLKTIADELQNAEVSTTNTINEVMQTKKFLVDDYFREYPIYQEIIKGLHSAQDTHSTRARIQYNLSEMSPMNTIFSRTRKREVTRDWTQAERNPVTERVGLTQDETQAYNDAIEKYSEDHTTYDEYGREHTGKMGLVTLRRQLVSSVWATLSNDELLSDGYDMYSKNRDSKFDALLHIIDTVFAHGKKKIIVFAVFKKTLKYLSIRLAKKGIKSVMIYGDSKINKNEQLDLFRDDDAIQVLLSSEVGSEGLDMQFCNSLVNYDLPWNPMVVEQRIGRIDRFGQESPKINIYNIVVTNSILEKIYERLLYRIGIFRESIGDLEAILDGEMNVDGKSVTIRGALQNVERQFYSDELSEEEVERKQQQIEQAVENEKLNLKNIEDGLTNTLTNDSYFRNEINKIVNNNAYVTGEELYQFVRQIIKECLSVCRISPTDNKEIFNLEIPRSAPEVVLHFVERYEPVDPDSRRLFSAFKKKIDGKLIIPMTFNQERAFKDKELTYINIYHPIIQAGVRMFEEKRDKKECTFFFELTSKNLPKEIMHSCYILAIYKVSVSRIVFDKNVKTDSLYPLLYDMSSKKVVADQELAEKFMGRAQVDGRYAPIDDALHIDDDTLDNMRYDLKDSIDSYVESYRKDLQNRIDNSKKLRFQQTIQYYSTREKSLERSISSIETIREVYMNVKDNNILRNAENSLRLLNANLRDLQKRKEKDLEKINRDVNLKVTEEIKSLNLVKVVL